MIQKIILAGCVAGLAVLTAQAKIAAEKWGMAEVVLHGPTNGNPFLDVKFAAQF